MKLFKMSFVYTFSVLFIINVSAQEKITLSSAITTALMGNTSIIQSKNNLETTNAAVKNAYGNLLPSLSFSGSWSWQKINDSKGTSQVDYLGNVTNAAASESDTRNYNLSLGGNVTLFDGLSNVANINQKRSNLQSAQYDLEKLRQDVILQTINLFITIINDEKILKFQEEDLRYNQELLTKEKDMLDLKMIKNADYYSQEYQTANSQLSFIQAKNNFDKAKLSLINYLSKDVLKDYSFELDSTYIPAVVNYDSSIDSLCIIAMENRNDYKSQKGTVASAEYQLTISKSGLLPSLSGNYSIATSSTQPSDLFSRKTYGLGLSLDFPIFSQWNTDYSIQSANVQIKNSNEVLISLERQIKLDVKNAVLDLQSAKSQLEVTKSALKSAEETWFIKRDSYLIGSATYIEQQQSYRDYVQANNNYITAGTNFIYKQFSLLSSIGLLKAE